MEIYCDAVVKLLIPIDICIDLAAGATQQLLGTFPTIKPDGGRTTIY